MEEKFQRKWSIIEMEIIDYLNRNQNKGISPTELFRAWSLKHSYSSITNALRNLYYMNILGKSATATKQGRYYAIRDRNNSLVKDILLQWGLEQDKLIKPEAEPETEVENFMQEYKEGQPNDDSVKESESHKRKK
jgi:predicted transcriptional regulator